MKLISSKDKQEIKRMIPQFLIGATIGFLIIIIIGRKTWEPLIFLGVAGVLVLIEWIIRFFKKEVSYIGIIIFMVFFMALFLSSQSRKPWGEPILLGSTGVYFLIFTLLLYKRTRMIYATLGNGLLIIAFSIRAIERLIIPEGEFWSLLIFPAVIFMLIMQQIEKKKNPEKMKNWGEATKKASFFEILSFKHIPKMR
ncbi:hypothetical protein KAW50_02895 [candidate division WOR-3 bacterium]|nr:hypothetical protein [candidate division WOR-3 bacterium]